MPHGGRPLLVLALAALTAGAVALDVGSPFQPLLVGLFLFVAPGTAVLVRAQRWPPLVLVMAIISTSLSIDVLLSTALFYAGWWSPAAVLGGLIGICLVATVADSSRRRHEAELPGVHRAPRVRP